MALFSDPPDKEVTAYDFWGNKQTRNLKNFRLRVSVYGLCKDKDKILVQHNPVLNAFGLPGGGVEIGEKVEEALKREFKEETGLEIIVEKPLAVTEDLFSYNEEDAFSILILYSVKITGGTPLENHNDEDSDGIHWMSKEELLTGHLLRVFHKFANFL